MQPGKSIGTSVESVVTPPSQPSTLSILDGELAQPPPPAPTPASPARSSQPVVGDLLHLDDDFRTPDRPHVDFAQGLDTPSIRELLEKAPRIQIVDTPPVDEFLNRRGHMSPLPVDNLPKEAKIAVLTVSAFCSWCFVLATHAMDQHNSLRRSVYACTSCHHRTLKCRKCSKAMARGHGSYDDEHCFKWGSQRRASDTTHAAPGATA